MLSVTFLALTSRISLNAHKLKVKRMNNNSLTVFWMVIKLLSYLSKKRWKAASKFTSREAVSMLIDKT